MSNTGQRWSKFVPVHSATTHLSSPSTGGSTCKLQRYNICKWCILGWRQLASFLLVSNENLSLFTGHIVPPHFVDQQWFASCSSCSLQGYSRCIELPLQYYCFLHKLTITYNTCLSSSKGKLHQSSTSDWCNRQGTALPGFWLAEPEMDLTTLTFGLYRWDNITLDHSIHKWYAGILLWNIIYFCSLFYTL